MPQWCALEQGVLVARLIFSNNISNVWIIYLFPITIDLTCSRNGLRTQSSLWFYSTRTCKAFQQCECPHNPISASFNANRMLHPSLSPSYNHLVLASQDRFFLPIRALGLWLGLSHSFIWALGPRAPSSFQRTISPSDWGPLAEALSLRLALWISCDFHVSTAVF